MTKIPILTTEMSAIRIMTVNFIRFLTNSVQKIGHVL